MRVDDVVKKWTGCFHVCVRLPAKSPRSRQNNTATCSLSIESSRYQVVVKSADELTGGGRDGRFAPQVRRQSIVYCDYLSFGYSLQAYLVVKTQDDLIDKAIKPRGKAKVSKTDSNGGDGTIDAMSMSMRTVCDFCLRISASMRWTAPTSTKGTNMTTISTGSRCESMGTVYQHHC